MWDEGSYDKTSLRISFKFSSRAVYLVSALVIFARSFSCRNFCEILVALIPSRVSISNSDVSAFVPWREEPGPSFSEIRDAWSSANSWRISRSSEEEERASIVAERNSVKFLEENFLGPISKSSLLLCGEIPLQLE